MEKVINNNLYVMEKGDTDTLNIRKNGVVIGTIKGYVTFCVNDFEVPDKHDLECVISLLNDIATSTDGGVFMYIHNADLEKIDVVKKLGGVKISRRKYLTYEIKR